MVNSVNAADSFKGILLIDQIENYGKSCGLANVLVPIDFVRVWVCLRLHVRDVSSFYILSFGQIRYRLIHWLKSVNH